MTTKICWNVSPSIGPRLAAPKQEPAPFFAGAEALGVEAGLLVLAAAFTIVESEVVLSETVMKIEVNVELDVVLGSVAGIVLGVVLSAVIDVVEVPGVELTSTLVVVGEGGGLDDEVDDGGEGGVVEDEGGGGEGVEVVAGLDVPSWPVISSTLLAKTLAIFAYPPSFGCVPSGKMSFNENSEVCTSARYTCLPFLLCASTTPRRLALYVSTPASTFRLGSRVDTMTSAEGSATQIRSTKLDILSCMVATLKFCVKSLFPTWIRTIFGGAITGRARSNLVATSSIRNPDQPSHSLSSMVPPRRVPTISTS